MSTLDELLDKAAQLDKDALVLLLEGVKRLTSDEAEEAFAKCREQVKSESQERAEPD
jgi:hypothetical protein